MIAFSTARMTTLEPNGDLHAEPAPQITDEKTIDDLYEAAGEATESAIDNPLLSSTTTTGRGSTVYGIPRAELRRVLAAPPPCSLGARPSSLRSGRARRLRSCRSLPRAPGYGRSFATERFTTPETSRWVAS